MSPPAHTDGLDSAARARLVEVIRLIHAALPESDLSAWQRVEIRHDLQFLVAESRRHTFRPVVAEVVCDAVIAEVAHALPAEARRAIVALG